MSVYRAKKKEFIILAFVIAVAAIMLFWPDDEKQSTKEKTTDSDKKTVSVAKLLYQNALNLIQENKNLYITDQKEIMNCCRQIIRQDPNSKEAEKAKALLMEVSEQYASQIVQLQPPLIRSEPKVKKTTHLRSTMRRPLYRPDRTAFEDVNIP